MTPEAQIKLAVVGLKVKYFKRWKDPRIAGFGDPVWEPRFVMLHHTGGTDSLGGLSSGAFGNHKPVPGANFLVHRDGSVTVLSKYISYHAGKGGPKWGVAANRMNPVSWGIEIEDPGKAQTMTAAQIATVAKMCAGLLRGMGQGLDAVVQHKSWSSTGKPDTRYSDDFWRGHIEAAMKPETKVTAFDGIEIPHDSKHPVVKLHDFKVIPGEWTTFATDWIEKSKTVDYGLGMQLRRAGGSRVQLRVARVGWGAEAGDETSLDATFYCDQAAEPYDSSHTYEHRIEGGGPIAFQVRVTGAQSVPTLIAKVKPGLKG